MLDSLKRILVLPDSYKGSLSAADAAQAMRLGIQRALPQAEIISYPMADGGEGTLDTILAALRGGRRQAEVSGASGGKIIAEYGVVPQYGLARQVDKFVAIIEVAQVVGLTLPQTTAAPVMRRSTLGVGEVIGHALDAGLRHFMIGLGGSGTNDGGAGLLQGLGLQLLDGEGQLLHGTPDGLLQLAALDISQLDPRLADCDIQILSDVDHPLCGPQGATFVFGAQKGVLPEQMHVLDAGLKRFASLLEEEGRPGTSMQAGAGAAGGLGFALQWLGGVYSSGAETLLQLYGFDLALQNAGWVITGEGRSDGQTLHGKAPYAVAMHAKQAGVPVTLISGHIDANTRPELEAVFDSCHALTDGGIAAEDAIQQAAARLADCAERAALQQLQ